MTRETVEFWLDKQVEICELSKKYRRLYDDTGELDLGRGYMMENNELFIHCHAWRDGGASFFYEVAELVAKTITFNPNIFENDIVVSFMYKGYKVYTIVNKKGGK